MNIQNHPETDKDDTRLRLGAVDENDLAIISTHLQDAEVLAGDMAYLPQARRFALVVSRFDWLAATQDRLQRRQTGLHFDCVTKVSTLGFDPKDKERSSRLLALAFRRDDEPSGHVLLSFADGGIIRLTVECLDAEMRDMGPCWAVDSKPDPLLALEALLDEEPESR